MDQSKTSLEMLEFSQYFNTLIYKQAEDFLQKHFKTLSQ